MHSSAYRSPLVRPVSAVLLLLCLFFVGLIVLWPTPVDSGSKGTLLRVLNWLHEHGLPEFVGYNAVEFTANVVMFVPLGLFAAVACGPGRWWIALIACPALSIIIESIQAAALPGRFATVGDVVANSAGGAAGALIGLLIIVSLRRRPALVTAD